MSAFVSIAIVSVSYLSFHSAVVFNPGLHLKLCIFETLMGPKYSMILTDHTVLPRGVNNIGHSVCFDSFYCVCVCVAQVCRTVASTWPTPSSYLLGWWWRWQRTAMLSHVAAAAVASCDNPVNQRDPKLSKSVHISSKPVWYVRLTAAAEV